ncbi:MAG: hypothetical protein QOJ64_4076 [Acidobacteriota bacterium]|jgi:RimJ/RimL family protein N-acetyltransferase|nr:hypothetical protein [Acidobacteriota bacterium]
MALGHELLVALKKSATADGPALCLPIGSPVRAILRPVATASDRLNEADVSVLTSWRNRFVRSFLNEFEATEEQTRRWLTEMVGPDETRILFMIDDLEGKTFGYMGLAFINWQTESGEADAIVRGGEAVPGLMTTAMRTMLNWARAQLGLRTLGVRVRSDNEALGFYQAFGFRETRRIPLRRTESDNTVCWVEDDSLPSGEPSLVHMLLPDDAKDSQNSNRLSQMRDKG